MRSIIKVLGINTAALFILSFLIPAITISGGVTSYLMAAAVLALLHLIVKPLLNLLFLPLNILTLGMFRWVTNTIIIWLTGVFVKNFHIGVFLFPGVSYQGIVLPTMELNTFWTTVVAAFVFSLCAGLLEWVVDK